MSTTTPRQYYSDQGTAQGSIDLSSSPLILISKKIPSAEFFSNKQDNEELRLSTVSDRTLLQGSDDERPSRVGKSKSSLSPRMLSKVELTLKFNSEDERPQRVGKSKSSLSPRVFQNAEMTLDLGSEDEQRPQRVGKSKSSLSPRVFLSAGMTLKRNLSSGKFKEEGRSESKESTSRKEKRSRSIDEVFEKHAGGGERSLILGDRENNQMDEIPEFNSSRTKFATESAPLALGCEADESELTDIERASSTMCISKVKTISSSPVVTPNQGNRPTLSPKPSPKSSSFSFIPRSPPSVMKEHKLRTKDFHSSDEEDMNTIMDEWGEMLTKEYRCPMDELKIVTDPCYSPHLKLTVRVTRDESVSYASNLKIEENSKMMSVYREIMNTEKNYLADMRKLIWVCSAFVNIIECVKIINFAMSTSASSRYFIDF